MFQKKNYKNLTSIVGKHRNGLDYGDGCASEQSNFLSDNGSKFDFPGVSSDLLVLMNRRTRNWYEPNTRTTKIDLFRKLKNSSKHRKSKTRRERIRRSLYGRSNFFVVYTAPYWAGLTPVLGNRQSLCTTTFFLVRETSFGNSFRSPTADGIFHCFSTIPGTLGSWDFLNSFFIPPPLVRRYNRYATRHNFRVRRPRFLRPFYLPNVHGVSHRRRLRVRRKRLFLFPYDLPLSESLVPLGFESSRDTRRDISTTDTVCSLR